MAKIVEVKQIDLSNLEVGKGQSRQRDTAKDLDELVDSIQRVGQLQPILVCPGSKPGKYEMLTGQRRFLAHKILKLKTIWAAVFDKKVDVITAKLISLTENLVRTELNNKDAIDVCTALYKHYGSIKAVVEETGLSYPKVSKYIKYDALMPELKKLVDAQTVPLATALRVQKAADWGDNIDPKKAVALAKEMSKMSGDQQQKVSEELQENPDKSISSVIKAAKTGPKGVKVVTILLQEHYQKLKSYAKTEGTTPADAAASLIVEGLEEKGFLEE